MKTFLYERENPNLPAEPSLREASQDEVFTDRATTKDVERPGFAALLEAVRASSAQPVEVRIASLATLGRSLTHLEQAIESLTGQGAIVCFEQEDLCFGDNREGNQGTAKAWLRAFARFEQDLRRERHRDGVVLARQNRKYRGRKRALSERKAEELRERAAAGEAKTDLARSFGISRDTVYEYLPKAKPAPPETRAKTVLYLTRDEKTASLHRFMLETRAYRVIPVLETQAALRQLTAGGIDLVVTTERPAVEAIKQTSPQVPVLLLAKDAKAEGSAADRTLGSGSPVAILAAVRESLSRVRRPSLP